MIDYAVSGGKELRTLDAVREAAPRTSTPNWFSPETLAWFNGRIESELIGRRWFITSERAPHGERKFTVRHVEDDGSISTPRDFMEFTDREDAVSVAFEYARDAGQTAPADSWVVESYFGGAAGWEPISYADSREEALDELRLYRENQPEARHRVRSGTVIIETFREGGRR